MLKHIRLVAAIALVSFAAMQIAPAVANPREKEAVRQAQKELEAYKGN